MIWDSHWCWLETIDTAERSWESDTSSDISSNTKRGALSGNKSTLSTTASATGSIQIMRVFSLAVNLIICLCSKYDLRIVWFNKRYSSFFFNKSDNGGIFGAKVISEVIASNCCDSTLFFNLILIIKRKSYMILYRNRNAVKSRKFISCFILNSLLQLLILLFCHF